VSIFQFLKLPDRGSNHRPFTHRTNEGGDENIGV